MSVFDPSQTFEVGTLFGAKVLALYRHGAVEPAQVRYISRDHGPMRPRSLAGTSN
jgi:hypothetical protein